MDLPSLTTELQYRGLDQGKVDSGLRLLVHVYEVQDQTTNEVGGILVEDVVNTYPADVVQAASELFLERQKVHNAETFRVKWGCDNAAKTLDKQVWELASGRWDEFVATLDPRFLGFILPMSVDGARNMSTWKTRKDLKWFSVEVPQHGWTVLRMIDDVTEVASRLDLAFGFRPFGPEGPLSERVLIHRKAYDSLKKKAENPLVKDLQGINLWRFFSEYNPEATDFVALLKECDLTLEDVVQQVEKFFALNLTSHYRDGQYPPYFVNEKTKKEFPAAVRALLQPMESWLLRKELAPEPAHGTPDSKALQA